MNLQEEVLSLELDGLGEGALDGGLQTSVEEVQKISRSACTHLSAIERRPLEAHVVGFDEVAVYELDDE